MGTYCGTGGSNWFKPKDLERLKRIVHYYKGAVVGPDENGAVRIHDSQTDGDLDNYLYFDPENGEKIEELISLGLIEAGQETDLDDEFNLPEFSKIIAKELETGQIFIWTHVGSDGYRDLSGYTFAVNEKGEELYIGLHQIANNIKDEWGVEVQL